MDYVDNIENKYVFIDGMDFTDNIEIIKEVGLEVDF